MDTSIVNAGVPANNVLIAFPFVVPVPVTLTEIGINVNVAEAASLVRLGLYRYDPSSLAPAELLVDAGDADCSTTGDKLLTFAGPVTINEGLVWCAYRPQTTGTLRIRFRTDNRHSIPASLAGVLGASYLVNRFAALTAATLPDPFPASSTGSGNGPVFSLKVGTLL
jgi:hypothetical protein